MIKIKEKFVRLHKKTGLKNPQLIQEIAVTIRVPTKRIIHNNNGRSSI
ncbi:MAG: hypothetical protein ABF649_15705 [Bacillus sp. (in: firmicutes)]